MSSDEGWEDDDEMADLFAFGNEGAPAETSPKQPPVVEQEQETRPPEREASSDSILDMLDGEKDASVLGELSSAPAMPMEDKDAQEILNWLNEEETPATFTDHQVPMTEEGNRKDAKEQEVQDEQKDLPTTELTGEKTSEPEKRNVEYQPPPPTIAAIPPLPKPEVIHFGSLEDALNSPQSTVDHLRALFVDGGMKVEPNNRPLLWCRAVSGKTVEQVQASSLADSFLKWLETANIEEGDDVRSVYIRREAAILAERIVAGNESMTLDDAKRALCELLFFHYQSSSVSSQEVDPLLPPVACTLLSAGFPTAAANVMLTYIMAIIPLLALTKEERWEAAKSLHAQFYLLACYHLPLLVFHLDRYAPGWYWPKKLGEDESGVSESVTQKGRNLESHGFVPQSWLVSHLAGECGGTLMNPMWLLSLWDLILTSSNNSLRFFLSLAVLDKHSDELLMLTGSDLLEELQRIMEFKEGTTPEGFAIVAEEETSESEADDWVGEWRERARALWEETPRSVVSQLRTAEDEAVKKALSQRQKNMEEELQARLEAEAKTYREAAEAEKERKSEEARLRLSRARLVAYYRTHNPEKEGNIDKIMEVYKGRLEVLDMKLKAKYGVGFNPALKAKPMPKISANKRLPLPTMNPSGLSGRRVTQAQTTKKEDSQPGDPDHQVAVKVSATEVLPVICWSKEAAASRGTTGLARGRYSHDPDHVPLKFYLVDSRPEAMAQEQGRFPTAVAMSPEALLDPDRLQQNEEMFESLRGAVHICIMGEGYSLMHELYGQKVTPKLQQAIDEDVARTSLCALFFIKKGFPFVSILDGGFVQAHSWLCREGPKRHLDVSSVLIDYDEKNSFFGRLEKQHSLADKSTREKTQYALQNLLDSSMTSLAMNAKRVENMASGLEFLSKQEGDEEASFVGGSTEKPLETDENEEVEVEEGTFVNSFASIRNAAAILRKGQGATVDPDKKSESSEAGGEKDTPTNADGAEPKFKNPFAGLRTAADNLRKSEAVPGTAIEEDGGAQVETPSSTTSMFLRNPFAARRSVAPEKGQEEEKQEDAKEEVEDLDLVDVDVSIAPEALAPDAPTKPGTFARFGSAADSLRKAASSSVQKGTEQNASQSAPKRNPFANWGQSKPVENEGNKPTRFGGINMGHLKVNLPNLRGKDKADREVEESVFFDHHDDVPAGGSSESAGDEVKTKDAAAQAVVASV